MSPTCIHATVAVKYWQYATHCTDTVASWSTTDKTKWKETTLKKA
jgi:hypothetical protein